MRYCIKLSYCGADFRGWQVQPDAPSVQATLESAISTLLRTEISVTGAGRTDTGVNAIGYVAHFDAAEGLDTRNLCYKLNAILPRSIAVQEVRAVPDSFHARFSATKREYTYFLHRVKDPFAQSFSYFYGYPELDFEAMNKAAALLKGTHDFRCFEKTGADNKTSICTVTEAFWAPYTPSHLAVTRPASASQEPSYWYFRISADRFLRNMVRAVVGTLLEVGRGKRGEEDFASLVLPPDFGGEKGPMRSSAGESVPGEALFLSDVEY